MRMQPILRAIILLVALESPVVARQNEGGTWGRWLTTLTCDLPIFNLMVPGSSWTGETINS